MENRWAAMSSLFALFTGVLLFAEILSAQTSAFKSGPVDAVANGAGKQGPGVPEDLLRQIEALRKELDGAREQIGRQQSNIEHLQQAYDNIKLLLDRSPATTNISTEPGAPKRLESVSPGAAAGEASRALGRPALQDRGEPRQSQTAPEQMASEGPPSIRYKGLSLVPGGFLEGTFLVRTRNENADIANSYANIPLNGSTNSKLSEFRGSARDSRLSLLLQGNAGRTELSGFFEMDFLGAAPTANYVEANSFTPRIRQAWAQISRPSGWTITGGQFWSLMTPHRHGIATRSEYIPNTADGAYAVGYTWTRGREFRVTKNFHDRVWAALELDQPENTFSAAFVPANVMGLNTSQNTSNGVLLLPFLPNFSTGISTTIAPDLLAKVAVEPGWGHFEIKALGRFFRDRIASTATTAGFTNVSYGWGLGFGAILPAVRNKVDIIAQGLAGQGIGRYGAAGLPDVTLDPVDARMLPLRSAQLFGGIEAHLGAKLDFFGYVGNEYVGRYPGITPTGAPAGYGSPLFSYLGCTNEVAMNTCSGANRDVQEATAGFWYRLYKGSYGTMQYGNQVVLMRRTLWRGIGIAPQGSDVVAFSTMRFYLP